MAIANRGVSSTEKKTEYSLPYYNIRDNFLIDLTDLVTGRSFKFVFQQRCFFINSSSLEFYVFQLEFRGINYCSFFIPPSSLILWPVKVYCFFSATV